jgi:hypothetical protein
MGQIEQPLLCRLRDWFFQITPRSFTLRTLAPVIGYEGHLK